MTKIYQSPTIVVGFTLFLALVIGTIYRINTAFVTYPGLVANDPYHAGKGYGKSIGNAANLAKDGYKFSMQKHNFIEVGKEFTYSAILNKNSTVVENSTITFYFYRPLEEEYDFAKVANFDGKNWSLKATLPRKGVWRMVVEASFGENKLNIFKKIFVNDAL